jgi:hypothetical protein
LTGAIATSSGAPSPSRRELFALGLSLVRSRASVIVASIFAVLVTLAIASIAAMMAARGRVTAAGLPGLGAEVLAWGPGMLVAFGGAVRALRNDAEHGIHALVLGRGVPFRRFMTARLSSLAAFIAIATSLGTLAIAIAATLGARSPVLMGAAMQTGFAGIVHSILFGAVIAPIAFATLGARSIGRGYVLLLLVLVVPELFRLSMHDLPPEWTELLSIPSALATARKALSPGAVDPMRALGAILVLAVVASIATGVAFRQARGLVRVRRDAS